MKIQSRLMIACPILLLLIAYIALVNWILPDQAKKRLQASFRKSCPECRLEIGSVHLSPDLRSVRFAPVQFHHQDSGRTRIEIRAKEVKVDFAPLSLLGEEKKIHEIRVDEPDVVITAGIHKSGTQITATRGGGEGGKKSAPRFAVSGIRILNGKFTYQKITQGETARIQLDQIDVETEELGTTPTLIEKPATARLTARLERSGNVELSVRSRPFSDPSDVYIDLRVRDQNLADLDKYFSVADGIQLQGQMIDGRALAHLNGPHIQGRVDIRYQGLDLRFREKEEKRSPIEALLSNIGKDLKIHESNFDADPSKRIAPVDHYRDADESVISSILNGLKDGAFKVATS